MAGLKGLSARKTKPLDVVVVVMVVRVVAVLTMFMVVIMVMMVVVVLLGFEEIGVDFELGVEIEALRSNTLDSGTSPKCAVWTGARGSCA